MPDDALYEEKLNLSDGGVIGKPTLTPSRGGQITLIDCEEES